MSFEVTAGRLLLDDEGDVYLRVDSGGDVSWRRLGSIGSDPDVPRDCLPNLEHLRREWAEHTAWDPRGEVGHFYAIAKGAL